MKILITGATGFVGKTLIPNLLNSGFNEVAIVVRSVEKAKNLFGALDLTIIESNKDMRNNIISYGPDIVLHMAALFNTKDDENSATQLIESNITFGTLILEAISKTNCKYFVNIGTFSEFLYGGGVYSPNNFYSASKSAFRSIIKYYQLSSNFKWINIVLYSPYGRNNDSKKVIDYLIDTLNSTKPIDFSLGEQVLDFIHVDDIADFFISLFSQINKIENKYIQFHLGTGIGHSIREVGTIIEKVFDKKINANWGGLPYRKLDPMHAVAPIGKNLEILGWKAKIELENGISILKDDLKRNGK